MAIEVFNRYETKFLMDTKAYNLLIDEISKRMEPDSYSNGNKFYTICNVYYDIDDNRLIRDSLSKPAYKEKLRLRSYGVPDKSKPVYMEIKKKYNGIVNKRRCSLSIGDAKELIDSHTYPDIKEYTNEQVLNEIYYFTDNYKVSPKVFIAYDRRAFFGKEDSDLRITFDTNIRTRRYNVALEKGDYGTQLLEPGVWLMEVKCSKAMPMWLTEILAQNQIYKTSFSKYGTEYKQFLKQTEELNYA
jgi:hypothetical protein